MKLMERMKQKRMGNKGFSLVELIIVIAIMAILIGIVGTQVIPYLNRAREAKDLQIINSFSTAAVTAYSIHAEDFDTSAPLTVNVFTATDPVSGASGTFISDIKELTGYNVIGDMVPKDMSSTKGRTITDVQITINWSTGVVTAQAMSGGTKIFDTVESYIGTVSGN